MNTILLVEDDRVLRETIAYNLQKQDYKVEAVGDGSTAIETARKLSPNLDLIVLDLMLPKIDGFEVCRILRPEIKVPIIMLTARDDEIDRIIGLEIGADDYITKPFSMREFLARVKAHLRRERLHRDEMSEPTPAKTTQVLNYGNLSIDLVRREVLIDGEAIQLKPKEFDLLHFLARHRGQALSRDFLLEHVWGWEYSGNSRTVDVHVRWLREKIEQDPSIPMRIVTVRGSGYRFEG